VYDLVIVDSPAAGHGLGILRTPRTFAEIARVGPIAHQAKTIAATIADRGFTSVIAVSTASEMPVSETLWLNDALNADGLELDAVIVNALYPDRFSDGEREQLELAHGRSRSPVTSAALGAALSEHARARSQSEQLQRLSDGLGAGGPPLVTLPYLFAEAIGPAELQRLADALGEPTARPAPTPAAG
jgi:anion-transporting  ArsA/GET3 family ATPase